MNIMYEAAQTEDIEPIYALCKELIHRYERLETFDYDRVMAWVRRKIEASIGEYTVVYANGKKAGYFHFYRNEDGQFELDDLYIFPEFQSRGIGTEIIEACCNSVNAPVMLYVFIENKRAVSLYKRLGFEVTQTVHGSRYRMQRKNSRRSDLSV